MTQTSAGRVGLDLELPFPERLRRGRESVGLSLVEAAFELRSRLPRPLWASYTKINRYELGGVDENDADPVLLAGLADVYDVDVEDLSPMAAERLSDMRDLLGPSSA